METIKTADFNKVIDEAITQVVSKEIYEKNGKMSIISDLEIQEINLDEIFPLTDKITLFRNHLIHYLTQYYERARKVYDVVMKKAEESTSNISNDSSLDSLAKGADVLANCARNMGGKAEDAKTLNELEALAVGAVAKLLLEATTDGLVYLGGILSDYSQKIYQDKILHIMQAFSIAGEINPSGITQVAKEISYRFYHQINLFDINENKSIDIQNFARCIGFRIITHVMKDFKNPDKNNSEAMQYIAAFKDYAACINPAWGLKGAHISPSLVDRCLYAIKDEKKIGSTQDSNFTSVKFRNICCHFGEIIDETDVVVFDKKSKKQYSANKSSKFLCGVQYVSSNELNYLTKNGFIRIAAPEIDLNSEQRLFLNDNTRTKNTPNSTNLNQNAQVSTHQKSLKL